MPPRKSQPTTPLDAAIGALPPEMLAQLAGQLLEFKLPAVALRPKSQRRPRRAEAVRYRLKVTLDDSHPPIWRRLDVRSDLTLDVVHQVLQAAFGWYDGHLHRFAAGGSAFDPKAEHYLCEWDVQEGDPGVPDTTVRLDETLAEPGDKLLYCYDYGDDWGLTLRLESVHPADNALPAAVCVGGRRSAPPEDCGGLRDAAELAEILEDPAAFDLDEVNVALTDPVAGIVATGEAPVLDPELLDLLNHRLRGAPTAAAFRQSIRSLLDQPPTASSAQERLRAVRPILWFLHHVGTDGLTLTSAGYLRPTDVSALAAELPSMRDWIGLANRETQSFPVLEFREAIPAIGLVRKNRGRLLLTKAGAAANGNPELVWRHLAERLPTGAEKSMGRPSGWLCILQNAVGEPDSFDLIADAMTALGWRQDTRAPVGYRAVRDATAHVTALLENLVASSSGWRRHDVDPVVQDLCAQILGGELPLTTRTGCALPHPVPDRHGEGRWR